MKVESGDKAPQSVNERVAKLRRTKRDAGLIKIELWVRREDVDAIKKYSQAITRKKQS